VWAMRLGSMGVGYEIRQYGCESSKTKVTCEVFKYADYLDDSAITFDVTLSSQIARYCAPSPKQQSQGQHESLAVLNLSNAFNTPEQKFPPLPCLLVPPYYTNMWSEHARTLYRMLNKLIFV
jgi:hypothetical protein